MVHVRQFPPSLILLLNPFIRLANKINWRFGRSYKCGRAHVDAIRPLLTSGMLVLTHKNYELTNLFISGYWTHAAMVTSADTVVEAISQGVVTKSAETFFATVDDFLILKPRFCSQESMRTAGDQAAEYVGYPYNYTFRPDEDSVYCSELIFRAYAKTPEWRRIDRTSAKGILEYNNGGILLPHSFSEAKRLWQHVIPASGDPAGRPRKCIVKYPRPAFLQVEVP
jgi:hypothetical protein